MLGYKDRGGTLPPTASKGRVFPPKKEVGVKDPGKRHRYKELFVVVMSRPHPIFGRGGKGNRYSEAEKGKWG